MKLKIDENGNAVLVDGKPVYVHDDGKEVPFDAVGTIGTIARLNKEAQTHREGRNTEAEARKTLEAQLKVFEGLDPEVARKALDTVSKITDGKLIDAGKVDEVRAAVGKTYEERMAAAATAHGSELSRMKADNERLTGQLHNEVIGGSFSRSKMIAEKLAIPPDLVQARFGSAFKIEDGKMVAQDGSGNKLYSRSRPGELADFDEALDMLVEQYPYRDHILKPSGAQGSGAQNQGNRGTGNNGKSISREQFDQLSPQAKSAHFKAGNEVID